MKILTYVDAKKLAHENGNINIDMLKQIIAFLFDRVDFQDMQIASLKDEIKQLKNELKIYHKDLPL